MDISNINFNVLVARQAEETRLAMVQHQARMSAMAARHRQELLELNLEAMEPGYVEALASRIGDPLRAMLDSQSPVAPEAKSLLQLLEQTINDVGRSKKSGN